MQKDSLSIVDFAKKIESNIGRKKDLIVPAKQMAVRTDSVEIANVGEFTPTEHFHRQIATFTDIPWKYYEKVRNGNPDLFAHNVNHWLGKTDKKRMVRTFNGDDQIARACLSDRYRRIDNEHIAMSVLPVLKENPHTRILSSQVTERKMYLMAAFIDREAEVKKGDVVQAGIIITNSEIGMSRFTVLPYIHRLVCLNGQVADIGGKFGFKQIHSGRRIEATDNMIAYTDEALEADDKALSLKMRDVVKSLSSGPMWDEVVNGLKEAANSEEIVKPIEAVQELGKAFKLNDGETNSVLTNLIKDGDLTKWGAGNAVTAVANEIDDYDRATELQHLGGNLMAMNDRDWHKIAQAAV
jgi:hypothetical protein